MRNALFLHMLILKTFTEFQIGCAKKDNALTQNKRTRTKTHNTRHRNVLTDREKAQTNARNAPQPKQATREEEQQLTEDKKPTKNRIEERPRATAAAATTPPTTERQRWQEGESVCCELVYDRRWTIITGRARHIQRLTAIGKAEITERQPLLTPHPPRPSHEDHQDRPIRIWLTGTPITSNGRSTAEI